MLFAHMTVRWLLVVALIGSAPVVARADERVAEAETEADAAPAPHVVEGYRNGRRIAVKVVTVDWADVEVRTAKALLAMRDAAAADGISIRVRSGFRNHEHQAWLYDAWRKGWGNKAARPGHSVHQSGQALDLELDEPATFAWLEANAARWGFRRTVRKEPWHWEYNKRYVKKRRSKNSR
jgi:D-alanyl-D-alanine carboxypeptidase